LPLDLATLLTLAPACAPAVAPSTLLAVARAESGFDPYAIGVNGPKPSRLTFGNRSAAAEAARRLISEGRNIDLGIAQINVRNLASLGLSIDAAFDPCRNLAASAQVLEAGFLRAEPRAGEEQAGLRAALSYYNTGRPDRGFENGYVARVTAAARQLVPALAATTAGPASVPTPAPLPRPQWEVFAGPPNVRVSFVLSPKPGFAQ
jgi:type IV secretion system protein VirB1